VTLAPAPIEKPCQLITAFWLCCTIRVLAESTEMMEAEPAATLPPDGRTCAGAGKAGATASQPARAMRLRERPERRLAVLRIRTPPPHSSAVWWRGGRHRCRGRPPGSAPPRYCRKCRDPA